jgi:hypothetical protein
MIEKKQTKEEINTIADNLSINVQKFLSRFEINSDPKHFSVRFKADADLYIPEAQLPDLWLKTRKPFNRNFCFIFEYLEVERKQLENPFPK